MSGNYLLDSNIIIALFDGEKSIINSIKNADEIFLPSIVIGELYYGAYNSGRVDKNIERIDQLRTNTPVLDCDDFTAKFYGQIKKNLKDKGQPIPENDIWIAAIAFQYGLTLVSRDQHFKKIDNLALEEW